MIADVGCRSEKTFLELETRKIVGYTWCQSCSAAKTAFKAVPRALRQILAASLVLALAVPAQALEIRNTKLYQQSAEAAFQALEFYGRLDRPEDQERVLEIGYRVAAEADFATFPFSFYLVDIGAPNAFALPGGHIFVTRGMLDLGLSDDMLACLLGHEIAHVVREHGQRIKRRAALLNLLSQAALVGVMLGAKDDDRRADLQVPGVPQENPKGDLIQGTAAAGVVFTELLLRKYSREFEDEADEDGQRLAAAAGFDPQGAKQLWTLMTERIPQNESYGYWRTHPFSENRLRAAGVRAQEMRIREKRSADLHRQESQKAILAFRTQLIEDPFAKKESAKDERSSDRPGAPLVEEKKIATGADPGFWPFLERSALDAWPRGREAEKLRLDSLHRIRDRELTRTELERDFGALVDAYDRQLAVVRKVDSESTLIATLESEKAELRKQAETIFPKALKIWQDGIYQTAFLETFLSNFPSAEPSAEMTLTLAGLLARANRPVDAVEAYLKAFRLGGDLAARATRGLVALTPRLDDLVALARLVEEGGDSELAALAGKRLKEVAPSFAKLATGAAFLKQYPNDGNAEAVKKRLETLAQNLYGEVVLYQNLGDHVKALDRIQDILENAPLTPAAEALRQRLLPEEED